MVPGDASLGDSKMDDGKTHVPPGDAEMVDGKTHVRDDAALGDAEMDLRKTLMESDDAQIEQGDSHLEKGHAEKVDSAHSSPRQKRKTCNSEAKGRSCTKEILDISCKAED